MELEKVPEKDSEHKQSKLVQFAIGSALTIAALLPTSGCEVYSGYSSPEYYGPVYRSPSIIIAPSPRIYRPHYREFNNYPRPRQPQHFNNRPYGNPPNHQRNQRR